MVRLLHTLPGVIAVGLLAAPAAAQPPDFPRGPAFPRNPAFDAPPGGEPAFTDMYECEKCKHKFASPAEPTRCPSCKNEFHSITDVATGKTTRTSAGVRNSVIGAVVVAVGLGVSLVRWLVNRAPAEAPPPRRKRPRPRPDPEADDEDDTRPPQPVRASIAPADALPVRARPVVARPVPPKPARDGAGGFEVVEDSGFEVVDDAPPPKPRLKPRGT